MNLQQARCFDTVARTGSFRSAAAALFLTQPSVSHHVAQLEQELGVELVQRSRQGASVTSAGAALLPRVRAFLAAADAIAEEADLVRADLGGRVRVASVNYALVEVVAEVVGRFAIAYPEHRLEVREVAAEEVVRRVVEEGDDIGVFGVAGENFEEQPALRTHKLDVTHLGLLAPVGHALLDVPRLHHHDVARAPLVVFQHGWAMRDATDAYFDGDDARIVCEVAGVDSVRALVAAGVGVAMVPRPSRQLPRGLEFRDVDDGPVCVTRLLLEPKRPERPRAATDFLRLLAPDAIAAHF
jgi:DNA-binding transcriptional LysR family regulator